MPERDEAVWTAACEMHDEIKCHCGTAPECIDMDRFVRAVQAGRELGFAEEREACAEMAKAEAQEHDSDGTPTLEFYAEEYARQCASDLEERIRARSKVSP
jgi:hypothetical protein